MPADYLPPAWRILAVGHPEGMAMAPTRCGLVRTAEEHHAADLPVMPCLQDSHIGMLCFLLERDMFASMASTLGWLAGHLHFFTLNLSGLPNGLSRQKCRNRKELNQTLAFVNEKQGIPDLVQEIHGTCQLKNNPGRLTASPSMTFQQMKLQQ